MHNYAQEKYNISSYSTVVTIMKDWDFQRVIYYPKPSFLTVCKHWLGIADPKTVFRLILTHSKNVTKFKTNYLVKFSDWLTDRPTDLLVPSDNRNLITTKAMSMIFTLLNVSSSWDMHLHQPLQLQRSLVSWFYWSSPCVLLYSIPFSTATWVTVSGMSVMASVWNLGKCSASRSVSYVILCLEC